MTVFCSGFPIKPLIYHFYHSFGAPGGENERREFPLPFLDHHPGGTENIIDQPSLAICPGHADAAGRENSTYDYKRDSVRAQWLGYHRQKHGWP